jgi:putative PIN family toxin of toxin-antitoxin system
MKIIIDTNVYFSAIGFGGKASDFLETIFNLNNLEIYLSPQILQEIETKIYSDKFDIKTSNRIDKKSKQEFMEILLERSNLIEVNGNENIFCRDPEDVKFLALARQIQADYIITGDKDLLVLKTFEKTKVLKPLEFLGVALV